MISLLQESKSSPEIVFSVKHLPEYDLLTQAENSIGEFDFLFATFVNPDSKDLTVTFAYKSNPYEGGVYTLPYDFIYRNYDVYDIEDFSNIVWSEIWEHGDSVTEQDIRDILTKYNFKED